MKRLPTRLIHSSRAFTLIEIMIVVAIIALIAAIALPNMLRARKRAQAVSILTDLRLIDEAMDQYAIENGKPQLAAVPMNAWRKYLKPNTRLYNSGMSLFGDVYGDQVLGILPAVPSNDWDFMSDVCNASFWTPYTRGP